MKILFYQWNAFMQKGIENAFKRMRIEYDVFFYQFKDAGCWENDDVFVDKFAKKTEQCGYDIVFSVNYVPLISEVCEQKGIKYISWVYDSPIHIRELDSMNNSCNEIYFFDRGQAQAYQKLGYKNVFHMPLAVDASVYEQTIKSITSDEYKKYHSPISMVGQLYKSDYAYICSPLKEYEKGYLEGIIKAQMKIYGGYFLDNIITDEFLKNVNEQYRIVSDNKFSVSKRELEYTMACEITGRERYILLALLSKRYKTALYSGDFDDRLTDVENRGYIDYYTQMPKAFACSDVNLNVSLKTIRTGIPLRILDIMACGGFLITNYQEELLEWFSPGEDIVIYDSIEDMIEKVNFYMAHDEERQKISTRGKNRVGADFRFDDRLAKLIKNK